MRPVAGVVLKHNGTVIAEGGDEAVGGVVERTAKPARVHHRTHHEPSSAPHIDHAWHQLAGLSVGGNCLSHVPAIQAARGRILVALDVKLKSAGCLAL